MSENVSVEPAAPPTALRRQLNVIDATAIYVGVILGSGIFVAPAAVSAGTSSLGVACLLWAAGAIVAMAGASCYAECGARLPHTGGFYVYYRTAFGPAFAFAGGWAAVLITYPASLAAIALLMAQYLGEVIPALKATTPVITFGSFSITAAPLCATLALTVAGILNALGLRTGPQAQRVLSGAKITALAALCLAALIAGHRAASPTVELFPHGTGGVLMAMVVLLWTYDGWSDVTMVAGELKDPGRQLGRTVLMGTLALAGVYIAVQLATMGLLAAQAAGKSDRVVSEAVQASFGLASGEVVAMLVVIATFGAVHGVILTSSRLAFAMAQDSVLPSWFGVPHPHRGSPARAILAVTVASAIYVWAGSFRNLLGFFSFAVWMFYGLTAIALLILRRRKVGEPVTWKAPGGFLAPAIILLTGCAMCTGLMIDNPGRSLTGLGMLLCGFVAYYLWRHFAKNGLTIRA